MTADPQAGDIFGGYVLERQLGRGGFGTVWLAQAAAGGASVALKLLGGTYGDMSKVRAEVELLAAAAAGESPHVVRVLDGGTEPVPYIVMEYVDGTDLGRELERRRELPQREVLRVAAGIADALAVLERARIVHRDIKPGNVLIDRSGTVKLADFGIAKIIGFDTITATSQFPMSMAYAAPEVWEGQPSHSSDIYAFGALLFHCLSGRPPFIGNPAEVFQQHRSAEPNIGLLPADTTPSLSLLIARCLAKRPEQRPAGAAAVQQMIAAAESELSPSGATQGVPVRETERFGPWVRQALDGDRGGAFVCAHESTGERALVELVSSDDIATGAMLRRAIEANAELTELGAARLFGTNRFIPRPGETVTSAPQSAFQFWVARQQLEATMPTRELSRADMVSIAATLLQLADRAAARGLPAAIATADLLLSDGARPRWTRPGLPSAAAVSPGAAIVEFISGLPLSGDARRALDATDGEAGLRELAGAATPAALVGVARAEDAGAAADPRGGDVMTTVVPAVTAGPAPGAARDAPVAPTAPSAASTNEGGHDQEPPRTAKASRGRSWEWHHVIPAAALVGLVVAFIMAVVNGRGSSASVVGPDASASQAHAVTTTASATARPGSATPSGSAAAGATPRPSAGAGSDTTLVSGSVVTVTVQKDVKQTWTFQGIAGQFVEVRADRDPTGDVEPELAIYSPSGESVASNYGGAYIRISARLAKTGTFSVRLGGRGGSGLATVRFVIDPYVQITPGETIAAELSLPDEVDRYQFHGKPGQFVEVRMVRDPASPIGPRVILRSPFGQQLIDDYGDPDAGYVVRTARLSDDGVFELDAAGHDASTTGKYSIELNIDPYIPFTLGTQVGGNLVKPAQRDRYQFQLVAGQRIEWTVQADPTGNVQPSWELLDPFGAHVDGNYGDSTAQSNSTARYTGAYLLVVGAHGETQHGGYTLTIR